MFKGKSKFYKEFMTNLIKDILRIIFGLICFVGIVYGFIQLK